MVFILQNLAQANSSSDILSALFTALLVFFIIISFVLLILWIYTSLALMKIAKRTNTTPAWLAWIPFANLFLLARIAKMHWWPILLVPISVFLAFISGLLDNSILTSIFNIINFILLLVFFIYTTFIWSWKMFEAVGRPGWWALMILIPGLGILISLILLGVAAWGNPR